MKNLFLLLLGSVFIFSSCNKEKGTITISYNKGTAIYANIDEIRATPLISTPRNVVDAGKIFIDDVFLLIGEKGKGIHVFDNSNPNNPINVSFIQLPYTNEFYVSGKTIYAETQYDLVKIDLSNINNPVLIDRLEYAFSQPLKNASGDVLVGFSYQQATETYKLDSPEAKALEDDYTMYFDYNNNMIPKSTVPSSFAGSGEHSRGTLNKIVVHSNHVYVLGESYLYTIDNSGNSMVFLKSDRLQNNLETIYAEDNHLFIGTRNSMIVMNISNPSSPVEMSTYNHPTSCDPVYPNGNVAYLTLRTAEFEGCAGDENSLDVLDISDVKNPKLIKSMTMTSPYGMALINNNLFVGEGANGLKVYSAIDPQNLVELASFPAVKAFDVIRHPTFPNRILTAGIDGLEQYEIDYNTMSISFLSRVSY
jgi:hypothetical protein